MGSGTESRKRQLKIGVRVTENEYREIKMLAAASSMSVPAFLRTVGLGHKPQSTIDQKAVADLSQLGINFSRLGALLKMWLQDGHRGQMAAELDIDAWLKLTEKTRAEIGATVEKLKPQ